MYFLQGLTVGLAYVAPIGLQNLFVINSAVSLPRSRAYLTAFIVMFFDITLALACFFGVGAIMEKSPMLQMIILCIGSIIVICIGLGLLKNSSATVTGKDVNIPIGKVISTACVVTWFNPQAIIDGSMMLGAFKATLSSSAGMIFITGVACASALWFLTVTTVVSLLGAKINDKVLRIINIICGIVIIFYGLKLAYNFIQTLI